MPPKPHAETPALREAFRHFRRLVRLIRPYWSSLLKVMVLGVVVSLFSVALPYLSKLLIDEVYPTRDVTLMHLLVLGILGVSVAAAVMNAIRGYFNVYTSWHLTNATGLLFFNHLQHLQTRFFDQHRVGEIMSRFADVRSSLTSVSRVFETLVLNGTALLVVPPFLFLLQWKLALVSLVTVPLTAILTGLSARVLRRYLKQSAEAYADLGAYQVEVLSHIRTLKAMAVEHQVYDRARRHIQGALRMQLKAGGYTQVFVAFDATIRALGTATFTWYAWTLILRREMTLGDYVAFSAYVGYLYNPLAEIAGLFAEFQRSAVSLGRMFEYLDRAPEQDPALAYAPPLPLRHVVGGDIRLREVSFGYSHDKEILHGVSTHFPRGSVTAVVGPSGAGKSSLLRIITRMEEPASGEVFVDGVPVTSIPLADLRRQVTVVWQEFSLMQGTVWDNLALGAPGTTRARVDDAVRLCRLESLVRELPQGYDTPVGEWGSTLSGGQRQRMALARALIRDSPVLLLDEATSNLDLQTEWEILHDLFLRMRGRTVVFVTHRAQTAALADRIVVVEAGRVAAEGTHAELMAGSELYRRLQGAGMEEVRRVRAVPQPV